MRRRKKDLGRYLSALFRRCADDGYDAADNSRKCYDLAIETMRKKLESFRCEMIGPHKLYLGDCRELLPLLGEFDAVVTDPPYGVPVMLSSAFGALGPQRLKNGRDWGELKGNDEEFDPAPFLGAKEVLLWGANHFAHKLPHNGRWLVWDKRCGVTPVRTQADCEIAWLNTYGAARIIRFLWDGVCQDEKDGPRKHPTEKPLGVMRWCMTFVSGKRVFDPFMGSGSTGVVCVKDGRHFTGVEIEPKYFDVACRRIEEATKQSDLFIEPPKEPQAEQLNMLEAL